MISTLKDNSINVPIEDPWKIVNEMGIPMPPTLLPGHLYSLHIEPDFQVTPDVIPINSLDYSENKDDKFYATTKPYYDSAPIGIALRLDNTEYQSILNLKLMSPLYRRLILESYYQFLENKIGILHKLFYKKVFESKITESIVKRTQRSSYINPFLAIDKSFMQSIVGSNINFAVKNYRINSIKSVKLLDWNTLPNIYNMNRTDRGIVTNPQVNGLLELEDMFESKFYPI